MDIQRRPAIASGCPLFLDALCTLAHGCICRVHGDQCLLGSGPTHLAVWLARAGASGRESESPWRWSTREAAGKVTPQEGAGGEGAQLAATTKRLPGPQAHAMQTRSAVPAESQSASQ
ncbi:hypothetical protein NDU88_003257 [Pleurodeles waltl]|uniref:Uncharacterized protein n=1 Tax=Pleurodeles waltl TaxID=8319 RepID=A0AAV7MY01_PLEWA|nr:hypothetical protein NDU88_003257 [Pleurodeles waltl]